MSSEYHHDLSMQAILITASEIQKCVRHLGEQISKDYRDRNLMLVCVLKGGVVFFADLIRTISIPIRCEFVQLVSYYDNTESAKVEVRQGLNADLSGVDVLIIEDIVDTGKTLRHLIDEIKMLNPESLKVCSLLDKPTRREALVTIDYVGFNIPNVFVVGYGLDYAQLYRNLPYIATLNNITQPNIERFNQP